MIRRDARDGERPEDCKRLQTQPLCLLLRHHQHRSRAVTGLGRIAGSDGSVLVKDGRKLGQRLGGGVESNSLIGVEDDLIDSDARRTLSPEYLLCDGKRDDLILEASLSNSGCRLEVALKREAVLLLPVHLVCLNEIFGAVARSEERR